VDRLAPDLPDPCVGLPPDLAHEVGDRGQPAAGVGVECASTVGVEPGRLHQIAVDVELALLERGIPDPDRPRAAVALKLKRALLRLGAAVEPVQNL
jgi:hypothetical protein